MARKRRDILGELGLRPRQAPGLPTLFTWLESEGLTNTGSVFDCSMENRLPGSVALGANVALAKSTTRRLSSPLTQEELKALKERYKNTQLAVSQDALWEAVQDASGCVRTLQWERLPADAMAFYRPFHFPPFDQWGIYLLIGPLLDYHRSLFRKSPQRSLFSPETLMHFILFEIFNHEFFHHLVESTATTLELIIATQSKPEPIYLRHRQQQALNSFAHPHAPLEEALANAYAYNALGFISRVKVGFKTAGVKAFQQAIKNHWKCEPAGYREAAAYIGGDYIDGAAVFLAQLLNRPKVADEIPLSVVAKHVMPSGFSSFLAKPDIPTWLVGSEQELVQFDALVPAPNEAYTQLFWPYNTETFDNFIAQKLAEEKARKELLKMAGGGKAAGRS